MQDKNDGSSTGKEVDSSLSRGKFFEIRVKGHLNSDWSDWFEGLEVKLFDNGEMILYGYVVDQAALMGVLNKLNRLNMTLLMRSCYLCSLI